MSSENSAEQLEPEPEADSAEANSAEVHSGYSGAAIVDYGTGFANSETNLVGSEERFEEPESNLVGFE